MQQVEYLMEGRQEVMELLFEELGDDVGGGGRNVEGNVSMKEFGELFGDNVRGGGRNVEGGVSMEEFLENFLEIMLEVEEEM